MDPAKGKTLAASAIPQLIRSASGDALLSAIRIDLAEFTTREFTSAGLELELAGRVIGDDRKLGLSSNGSDETVGVGTVLRIAGDLIGNSVALFGQARTYSGGALLRQLVEIEYLAWAFEARDRDAERWLRSNKSIRQNFFSPRKLREAAGDKFRSKDYGFHCELGGHPVPQASMLLDDDGSLAQLLLADLLGHSGRIWDHLFGWSSANATGQAITSRNSEMVRRYMAWKQRDPLAHLPPPP